MLISALQASGQQVSGLLETDPLLIGKEILGVKIFDQYNKLREYLVSEILLVNGIGSVNIPIVRARIFKRFKEEGYQFLTVVHPNAFVAADVKLGEGCQVMAGAIIQAGCDIADNVVINTKASIDHDCRIGRHVHVAPGVTCSGGVSIGDLCHIGTGAVLIQKISLVDQVLVAAGAVVVTTVVAPCMMRGVPAKKG